MSLTVPTRQNVEVMEAQYALWQMDPSAVDPQWASFFEGFELGMAQLPKRDSAAKAASPATSGATPAAASQASEVAPAPVAGAHGTQDISFFARVVALIYNYRTLGHTQAHINPLEDVPVRNPRLALDQFGLGEADMERISWNEYFRYGERMPLRDIVTALEDTYCANIGFEFMHIHNTEVRHWVRARIEDRCRRPMEHAQEISRKALEWVLEAETFENFLGKRFLGEKRFSNEGGEGAMILLNAILEACPDNGVREIEMGMSHRGRMNVLANFVRKSLTTVLYEFTPNYEPDSVAGDGDVKYHLGYESNRQLPNGEVRISLAANPSHLEAVNSVVEGKARARQRILSEGNDESDVIKRSLVLPILMHGDAAFAGQGSVAECLNLSQLDGYRTGGTIHIIINNQIGFTTIPSDARSSAYATDVAKMIEAPILHVNGEKPLDLYWAAMFALEFRQKFGRDVVIDMYCYRRQGHNEADQAAFTQPAISRKISTRPTFGKLCKEQMVEEGILGQAELDKLEANLWQRYENGYQKMLSLSESGDRTSFSGSTAVAQPEYSHAPVPTGVSAQTIETIGAKLTQIPDTFHVHPTLAKRFIPRRAKALDTGEGFDWAFAESLAFGSLLMEGIHVRLSGQDVERGTFSQRHSVLYDHETTEQYIPLLNLAEKQGKFCVHNSLLSEFAVLGFDYGYSLTYSKMLSLWEAQFGDFANGAQVIFDQFICSAESKWQLPTDLVVLLPHGYEGMGPEHSSGRLERFLQLCAERNMVVGNFTTPAQYFHALRRQKHRAFRKPLVLMSPKSLLGHAEAVSPLEDFLDGTCFQEALPDPYRFEHPEDVDRVIFCTGKVFYDLMAYREEHANYNTAIIRIEQLYPFHRQIIEAMIAPFGKVQHFVWCQEEPLNMGAWSYIWPRLDRTVHGKVRYAGRDAASSPAAGSKAMHYREQKELLAHAFTV